MRRRYTGDVVAQRQLATDQIVAGPDRTVGVDQAQLRPGDESLRLRPHQHSTGQTSADISTVVMHAAILITAAGAHRHIDVLAGLEAGSGQPGSSSRMPFRARRWWLPLPRTRLPVAWTPLSVTALLMRALLMSAFSLRAFVVSALFILRPAIVSPLTKRRDSAGGQSRNRRAVEMKLDMIGSPVGAALADPLPRKSNLGPVCRRHMCK